MLGPEAMTNPFRALGAIVFMALVIIGEACLSVSTAESASDSTEPAEAAAVSAEKETVMVDARVVGDDKRTRFVADLSGPADVGLFTLADPYRVILDLPKVRFGLPEGLGSAGRGLISAFRYGQISPGKSRIVLDVAGPVKVDKSFVLPSVEKQPARLVIDIVPTSRKEFLEANREYRDAQNAEAAARRDRELVPRPKDGKDRIPIVLDPGHGGIDAGARGSTGVEEKKITLEFAQLLGARLEATGLYDVHYTRTDDSFIALGERVALARSISAKLFVSIHANSFSSRAIRGTVIYTVSDDASDKMAAEIAASENQSDILAGIDIDEEDSDGVMDILIDLTRRETRNFGVVFARNLVKELKSTTKMFKVPHQQAGFKVLEAPDVPSAMVELGYLSNKDDEKQLLSPEWREKAADSIVRAIGTYFEGHVVRRAER
jgi:N-acetylmuramoyl-L-alanine amidase